MEAVGHKEAFDFVSELVKDNVPISENVIKQIHYLVLADKKEDRGVYRRVPVRIMGAQHEPVQPYLIEPKMEQLLRDFAESTEHIVTKLARFHIEFEGIHPFIEKEVTKGDANISTFQPEGADFFMLFSA